MAQSVLSQARDTMLNGSYMFALAIGVLGSSVIHFSQGLMKLGILRRQEGKATARSRCAYGIGVVLNFTAPFWVIVANRFGPTVLYTSMYAVGLLPLLVFSAMKLKHRVSPRDISGAILIVLASVALVFGVAPKMAPPLPGMNILPMLWVALALSACLYVGLQIASPGRWISEGLLLGLVGGCFLAMDSLLKGIAQADGGVVGFLPITTGGAGLFLLSFVGAGIALGMTQWAHVRGAAPAQTIAAYDAAYISLPILLLPVFQEKTSLDVWCVGGLVLMIVGLLVLNRGTKADSDLNP